jgi:exopolysaccharide biosynthesis polyprenyl glycosylphosphotransferase
MRFPLLALVLTGTIWAAPVFHTMIAYGAVCVLAGLVMAAVVFDRNAEISPAISDHASDRVESSKGLRRALIIGAGSVGQTLAEHLEANGKYQVVGFVDDSLIPIDRSYPPVLGGRDMTPALVRQYKIDEVFLAYAPTWQQRLAESLTADHPEVTVRVVPSSYEALMSVAKVETMGDIALVKLSCQPDCDRDIAKRIFDIACGIIGLTVFGVPMLIVSALIKLTSRGPIIFAQERTGLKGKTFVLFKFRTMRQDAEKITGPVLSTGIEDWRLTKLGRWLRLFRIDELPQLINVLRGEMSMVGPRPERPFFVEKFESMVPTYSKRHQVRPGITGLAQVCGGYHTDARDKLRFDLIYVSHRSVWLDLKILLRTVLVILLPKADSTK